MQAVQVGGLEGGADGFPTAGEGGEGGEAPERVIGGARAGEFPSVGWQDECGASGALFPPRGPQGGSLGAGGAGGRLRFFEKAGEAEEEGFASGGGGGAAGNTLGEQLEGELVVFVAEGDGGGFVERGVGSAGGDHGSERGAFAFQPAACGFGEERGEVVGCELTQWRGATSGAGGGEGFPFGGGAGVVGETDLRDFAVGGGAREMEFARAADDDVKDDILVSGIGRVAVLLPAGGLEIDFDGAAVLASVEADDGLGEVRSGFAVPLAEVGDGNRASRGGGEFAAAGSGEPAGLPGEFVVGRGGWFGDAGGAVVQGFVVSAAERGHGEGGKVGKWEGGGAFLYHGFFGVAEGAGGGGAISLRMSYVFEEFGAVGRLGALEGAVDEFEGGGFVAEGLIDAEALDDGAEGFGGVFVMGAGGLEGSEGFAGFAVETLQHAKRFVVEAGGRFAGDAGEVERLGESGARALAQLFLQSDPWCGGGVRLPSPVAGLSAGEGAVERVADDGGHPREDFERHVSALGEGEALEEAFVEDIEVRGEVEVGFVDIAEGGGGTAGDERGGPLGGGIAQAARAEGMDVDGDGAGGELRCAHRAAGGRVIPAVVKCGVSDGEPGREDGRVIVEDDGQAVVPAFGGGILQPVVALAVAALGDAAAVDVGPAVEPDAFGQQAVIDHAAHSLRSRSVETCHEHESYTDRRIEDGGKAAVIGVVDDAEGVVAEGAEDGEFGVDRGFVVTADGIAGVRAGWWSGVRCGRLDSGFDFQGDTAYEGDEADAVGGDFALVFETAADGPPLFAIEEGAQGLLDGSDVLLAGDFLFERAVETDNLVGGYSAAFGVVFREGAGFGIAGVEKDERGDGFAGLADGTVVGAHVDEGRGESEDDDAKFRCVGRHGRGGCGGGGVFPSPRGRGRVRCG